MSNTKIYILRLEKGKYYVGKSDDLVRRRKEHLNGTASAWTKKYKPLSVEKIIPDSSPFDEDKYTKEYMNIYGIDNVRGGTYSQIELSVSQKEMIQCEINGATDACHQCGEIGHFIRYCPNKNKVKSVSVKTCYNCGITGHSSNECNKEEELGCDDEEEWECQYCDRTFTTAFGCGVHEKSCNNKNTNARNMKKTSCKEEEWECDYCDRSFSTAFGCGVHEKSCNNKNRKNGNVKKTTDKRDGVCYRCGNSGHYSPDCYASKHVNGNYLD